MPLPNLPHRLCTQLLTTSLSSLSQTSLPYSKTSLAISSILLRQGLITSLTLGTPTHPDPTAFASTTNPLPPSAKRIWVQMKYRNGQPVLKKMGLISKPSLRVLMSREELGNVLMGRMSRNVHGLGIGEVLIVKVNKEKIKNKGERAREPEEREIEKSETYLEGWEAWRAGLGGEIVCRAG